MFKVTSNAEDVFAEIRAKFSDKKGLLQEAIEQKLRELFPDDDLDNVQVSLTETDEHDRFNVSITGLTQEQEQIWEEDQTQS